MPYYGKRRSNAAKRRNSNLSNKRIYGNKSAKAQATQIASLRNQFRWFKQSMKPEIKVKREEHKDLTFTPSTLNTAGQISPFILKSFALPVPAVGTDDNQRVGDKVRMYNPTMWVDMKYSITGASDHDTALAMYHLNSMGAGIRFVIVQCKNADQTFSWSQLLPGLTDGIDAIDTLHNLTEPFSKGITTKFRILYDKIFYSTPIKPITAKRIKIKIPKSSKNLRWIQESTLPQNRLYCFIIGGGFNSYAGPQDIYDETDKVEMNVRFEQPFTDI